MWSCNVIGPAATLIFVREPLEPGGGTERLLVVLHQDPVVEHGDPRRVEKLSGRVEPRAAEGDVEGLPLAGRPRRVEQRRVLAVDRPGLAVGVGLGLVRVEHLDLELAHQEDSAVAAVLPLAARRLGGGPLGMELDISKFSPWSRSSRSRARFPSRPSTSFQASPTELSRRRGWCRRTGRPHPWGASPRSRRLGGFGDCGLGAFDVVLSPTRDGGRRAVPVGGQAGDETGKSEWPRPRRS